MFCDKTTVMLLTIAVATLVVRPATADLVKLRSGGEIRGKLFDRLTRKKGEPVVVETLSGGIVAVEAAVVKFVARRPMKVEIYESRAKRTAKTVAAQWKLAEWCRSQRLRSQRKDHLRLILEIDTNHKRSRLALGYSKYDGTWMTRDEWNRSRGLVKYKGKYITPEELELIEKSNAELAREKEWYRKVRLWKNWLSGRYSQRRQNLGVANLRGITDPDAVPALSKNFRDESKKTMRTFYVNLLARMKGIKPVAALVYQSLHDSDYEVRYAALNGISKEQYAVATGYFVGNLKNGLVVIVRRAADGLLRVGDERAIPALINALTTTHRYKIRVPDKSGIGFGTNGSFGSSQSGMTPEIATMLRSGQFPNGVIINNPQSQIKTKIITVKYRHNNRPVLAALERLSGASFGYSKRDWRLWLASTKKGKGVKSP